MSTIMRVLSIRSCCALILCLAIISNGWTTTTTLSVQGFSVSGNRNCISVPSTATVCHMPCRTTTVPTRPTTALFLAAGGEPSDVESTESSSIREDRYKKAMEEAKTMKVAELKNELSMRGIATGSFIEKTEFVKAYATAMADNIPKDVSSQSKSRTSSANNNKQPEEPRDPSYRDVDTQKFDKRRLSGQSVIDVSIR